VKNGSSNTPSPCPPCTRIDEPLPVVNAIRSALPSPSTSPETASDVVVVAVYEVARIGLPKPLPLPDATNAIGAADVGDAAKPTRSARVSLESMRVRASGERVAGE
jgi:hypothetical protein